MRGPGIRSMINRILALCCIVLAAAYGYATSLIPALESGGDPLGPKALPWLLVAALIGCAGLLFAESRRPAAAGGDAPAAEAPHAQADLRTVALALAVIGAYFALFEPLGYLLATTLFLAAAMPYCHSRRSVAIATALVFPAVSYLLLTRLLGVPLPAGALFS